MGCGYSRGGRGTALLGKGSIMDDGGGFAESASRCATKGVVMVLTVCGVVFLSAEVRGY